MFRRAINTAARATLTLFLRDFFENVTSQNFEDLRVGTSIHVVLRNLAIKRQVADQILKNTPLKLVHCGIDRLQAELTLNTKQARKLLLQEVHVVLEFDPDWVPPPPTNDAPPPIPSGISGAAAIVYSANTGEVLEDSFLRDDMKDLLSKRDFGQEEAFKMPEDEVDRSASAVAALLKELVHHSELAIDGFTVRIKFPASSSSSSSKTESTTAAKEDENKKQTPTDEDATATATAKESPKQNRPTNEIFVRFPSIFIRDKTVFDGKPSDQFSKFISIAPPIIQVYPLKKEDFEQEVSSTERALAYEDTLMMGYGYLHASEEMARVRDSYTRNGNNQSPLTPSEEDDRSKSGSEETAAAAEVEALDFSTVMESQRCVTIEIVRKMLQPRIPTWDVKISTTPFLMCCRPYQIGLLLDIGFRVQAQTKLQEKVLRQRQDEAEHLHTLAMKKEQEKRDAQNFPRNFYNNNQGAIKSKGNNNNNSKNSSNDNFNNTNANQNQLSQNNAPPSTFHIAIKCQHGVIALFSSDDVEPIQDCWESIEDYDSFITPSCDGNNNNDNNNINSSETTHIPLCLANQRSYFALSLGSGKIVIEKNNSKNSVRMLTNHHQSGKNKNKEKSAADAAETKDEHNNNNNDNDDSETNTNKSDATPTPNHQDEDATYVGDTEMERFLDRYTETTFHASLGSLVFVERASSNLEIKAVKIIEVDGTHHHNHANNNNNGSSATKTPPTTTTTDHHIAGEIILRITEQIPFHEVMKYKCINLSGVRHRHPTTNEAFSEALLRSTVTVKDVCLNTKGKAIVRLEPTVLSRVVDLMNYINSDIIKVAMQRNAVPLPSLKDVMTKSEADKNENEETERKKKEELANNNNNNNSDLSRRRTPPEPFDDDATTVSLNFKEIDLQCLLLKSRMPAADIWGPLTCRLFDHLASFENGSDGADGETKTDEHSSSSSSHLLPRCFAIRGNDMKFVVCPGTEPTLAELSITSAEALIQQENGKSRTLLRISPSNKIPQFSLVASVKTDAFGVSNVSALDKIATEIAERPTADQLPIKEKLKNELSSVAVDIKIPKIHGVTDILMDDMIFVLFAVTELSELTLPLVRYIPLDETAAYVASKSFIPNSVTSVSLLLEEVSLFIGAPRLDKHGVCLGDPLSSLLPADQAPKNLSLALHRYELRASQLTLTMGIAAITQVTQHWGLALGLGGLSLREHLIQLDGHPGAVHILLDSFADAHRRSWEGAADVRRGRSGRVFNLTLIRDTCLRKRSDLMQIGVVVECVSLVQQASYEGDGWPAVLAHWAADSPMNVKAGQKVHARGAVQKADVVPLSAAITVNVVAKDLLLDWKAEMRKERLAILVSALEVEIPELVTGDPKLTATVRVPEPAALLLHNDFPTPIIEFDRAMYVSGVNIFGSTRKGALEDLQYLGFAQLCKIGPRPSTSASSAADPNTNTRPDRTPTIVVRKSHPSSNRKLQVEVHHFFSEFSFAPDSCALFIAFIEHSQDPKYVNQCVISPLRLTRSAGGAHFSNVFPSVQQIEEAPVRAYVQDFDFIDELQHYKKNKNNQKGSAMSETSSVTTTSIQGSAANSQSVMKGKMQQSSRHHRLGDDSEFNASEWDLPELDESGRERPNAFIFKPNVLPSAADELLLAQENEEGNNENDDENQQQQQQQRLQQLKSRVQQPTLGSLMSDLYYFQPPIFDESAIAEPLFNVPSIIEFELLLHSCDFKFNFFAGSDFEMLRERGQQQQQHQDPNATNMNSTTSERFGFDEDELTRTSLGDDKNDYYYDGGDDASFHSINMTIPIFDVNQRRQRKRRARNSNECVALWLMHCFTQVDVFPSLESYNDDDENDNNNSSSDENETGSNNNKKRKSRQQKKMKHVDFTPIRQIIFRAGDIEVEDLVHESPVRKMLYCALPKSQRDAPVVTLRMRTLQKDSFEDDDVTPASSSSSASSLTSSPNRPSAAGAAGSAAADQSTTFESMLQKKIFQKLEAQQVSLRLLPLGVNVSARTVLKVISAFVNMNKTKVAVTNKQTLPSVASAATSLASLAHTQNSGISAMRAFDSNSKMAMMEPSSSSSSSPSGGAPPNNSNEIPEVTAPPTFFDKLIIHPLDVRVSWFPDESLYNDKQLADALGSQWLLYVVRYLAIEGARLSLSRISLTSAKAEDIAEKIMVEAWPQLKTSKLLLLLAGLQPVRPAAEIAGALGDLVLTPLEYWQHQRSIFVGIARGIQTCTSRLVAESLTLSATGTRLGQHAALAATKGIQRNPTPHLWGNQPQSVGEGAVRALRSAEKGLLDFGSGVLFCVDEMKQSSVAGGLLRLPLAALIPVEGVLRGTTEALLGVRNTIRPEERMRDTQEYKSSVFSHKRGDSSEDDE